MITAEPNARNHILILALSASGGRVSEASSLRWRDGQTQKGADN
jgi:integrase